MICYIQSNNKDIIHKTGRPRKSNQYVFSSSRQGNLPAQLPRCKFTTSPAALVGWICWAWVGGQTFLCTPYLPPLNHLKLRWRQVTSIRLPGTFLGLRNGLNFQADDAMMLFVAPGSMSSTWSWRFAILILRSYVERTLGYNFEIARYFLKSIFIHKLLLSYSLFIHCDCAGCHLDSFAYQYAFV